MEDDDDEEDDGDDDEESKLFGEDYPGFDQDALTSQANFLRLLPSKDTTKNRWTRKEDRAFRRLKFIQYRTGVWKCHRSLFPDPSPSTG